MIVVPAGLDAKKAHYADFFGTLARSTSAAGGNGGDGKDSRPTEPEDLTWDLRGHFKVFADHEGTGNDLLRTRVGTLVSDKTHVAQEDAGEARYDKTTGQFIGTFSDGSISGATGQHIDSLNPHIGTRTPVDLQKPETKPCPDGDKFPLIFVHVGVETKGRFGGVADPDLIQLNTYTASPTSAAAKIILDAANVALAPADAALVKANQDVVTAEQAVVAAQKALNVALLNVPAVKTAQARVDAASKALEQAKAQKAADDKTWARELADYNANPKAGRYAGKSAAAALALFNQIKAAYEAADKANQQTIARATTNLGTAETALATAKAAAASNPAVKNAQAALTTAQQVKTAADQAVVQAKVAVAAAKKTADEAQVAYDAALDFEAAWKKGRAETLVHELGHRQILHFYADKLTDWFNRIRVWGYAPTEGRARSIAQSKYRDLRDRKAADLIKEHSDFQDTYDSPQGSDHGLKQDSWDWGRLK